MKTFLVCCDHEKVTVQAESAEAARQALPCKKCCWFELTESKWQYRDIRVYASDGTALHAKRLSTSRKPTNLVEQLDWVTP